MLRKRHMVIACTDDLKVNKRIYDLSRKDILICNIADTPPLCDYYLRNCHQRPCENCDFDQRKITYNCQAIASFFEEVIQKTSMQWSKI
jgi:precorrin-2 dehydrogenase/sirohydrochlorin ferrochelatase